MGTAHAKTTMLAWRAAVLWGAAAFLYSACGNSLPPPPFEQPGQGGAGPAAGAAPASRWARIAEAVTCVGGTDENCAGYYGFSLDSQGDYTAGPSPDGSTVVGTISSSELSEIDGDASAVALGNLDAPVVCTYPSEAAPGGGSSEGTADRVDLTVASSMFDTTVYEQSDAGMVCTVGDAAGAEALHSEFLALLQRYYPTPFPASSAPVQLKG